MKTLGGCAHEKIALDDHDDQSPTGAPILWIVLLWLGAVIGWIGHWAWEAYVIGS